MFKFPLGMNLGSSALIVYLYQTTSGFGKHFTIHDLTLFYTTRPRLSWLMLLIFMEIDTVRQNGKNYIKSAKAAMAADMIVQIITRYHMRKIADLAAKNGYYSHPKVTRQMLE